MINGVVNLWSIVPFWGLLLAIALLPLIVPRFWDKNKNKAIVAFVFSVPVLWVLIKNEPAGLLHSLEEYFSFIVLLGSLFTVSGGIRLSGDLAATPRVNTIFLAIGAVIANIFGTTGASMLLIRPFLKTNSERRHVNHLPVFFIFVVANIGGLLTPIGDPPLFLGYLRGVPFFWTLKLIPEWVISVGLILTVFYFFDRRAYRKERKADIMRDEARITPLKLEGKRNFIQIAGILYAVFLPTPWRELVMISMAVISLVVTPKGLRRRNNYTWHPIVEVAILFAGIFITMVPVLELLKGKGASFGINSPWQFFWLTGGLSSFLDNAPTYLTFFSLAQGLNLPGDVVDIPAGLLKAISVGAVVMGANTYIGNGPNFMVKAIADHAGFKTPSFFGYMLYSIGILIPIFLILTVLFFV